MLTGVRQNAYLTPSPMHPNPDFPVRSHPDVRGIKSCNPKRHAHACESVKLGDSSRNVAVAITIAITVCFRIVVVVN
jgi:hypothetical protein